MCMAGSQRGRERSQECALHRIAISLAAHLLPAHPTPARPYGGPHMRELRLPRHSPSSVSLSKHSRDTNLRELVFDFCHGTACARAREYPPRNGTLSP